MHVQKPQSRSYLPNTYHSCVRLKPVTKYWRLIFSTFLVATMSLIQATNSVPEKSLPFDHSLLKNHSIGHLNNQRMVLDLPLGLASGYGSEKHAVRAIQQIQLVSRDDVALVRAKNRYFIYGVQLLKKNGISKGVIRSYPTLQSADIDPFLVTNTDTANLILLATSNGSMRFYECEASTLNISLVADDIHQVLDILNQLQNHYGEKLDHKGLFPSVYKVTTQKAIQEIERYKLNGQNKEARFIEQLIVDFGKRYFQALQAYTHGQIEDVPEIWRRAFDTGRSGFGENQSRSLEILSLSIIAHITHDLSLTLSELGYDPTNDTIKSTFLLFNKLLLDEKNAILNSIELYYGHSVINDLNAQLNQLGGFWFDQLFIHGRRKAAKHASKFSSEEIVKFSLRTAHQTSLIIRLFYSTD